MSLIQPNLENYVATRASTGARSQHNGDPIAEGLAGMTVEEVKVVAETLGVEDVNKYDALNPGQIRMNLGNRIRGRVTRINKENAALEAKAESEDATPADKKAAKNLKSGEEQFDAAVKPLRKEADARIKEMEKAATERAAKAEANKANKAEKASNAKGKGKKAA